MCISSWKSQIRAITMSNSYVMIVTWVNPKWEHKLKPHEIHARCHYATPKLDLKLLECSKKQVANEVVGCEGAGRRGVACRGACSGGGVRARAKMMGREARRMHPDAAHCRGNGARTRGLPASFPFLFFKIF